MARRVISSSCGSFRGLRRLFTLCMYAPSLILCCLLRTRRAGGAAAAAAGGYLRLRLRSRWTGSRCGNEWRVGWGTESKEIYCQKESIGKPGWRACVHVCVCGTHTGVFNLLSLSTLLLRSFSPFVPFSPFHHRFLCFFPPVRLSPLDTLSRSLHTRLSPPLPPTSSNPLAEQG